VGVSHGRLVVSAAVQWTRQQVRSTTPIFASVNYMLPRLCFQTLMLSFYLSSFLLSFLTFHFNSGSGEVVVSQRAWNRIKRSCIGIPLKNKSQVGSVSLDSVNHYLSCIFYQTTLTALTI
jgi:hypothetical protein